MSRGHFIGLNHHRLMLQDALRMDTYRQAIQRSVRPGMRVMDLGTGTGILAMWAAQAGDEVVADEPHAVIERLQREARLAGASELITIDGVRAEYPDGFGLARASNTTPVIVLRFEGDTPEALARIQDAFRTELKRLAPDAHLPF